MRLRYIGFFIFIIFLIYPASSQVTNGFFNDGLNNWTHSCSGDYTLCEFTLQGGDQAYAAPSARIFINADSGYSDITQTIDVTGYNTLRFYAHGVSLETETYYGILKYYIGGISGTIPNDDPPDPYVKYEIDISGMTGEKTLKFESYGYHQYPPPPHTAIIYIDNIELVNLDRTLSGYVTNNIGNPVSAATITLNNSGGSTNSNDTGYYEITGISSGTYSITATSPTHQDYSGTVSITADTEKNITMTRLSPLLTWTDAETTMNDVILKWKRNIVVDNVRIYKDTETRLLTTVSSGSTLAGLYSDRNLDCDKGYVYWLQPMDNDVAGPKYRIDAKTDPCDGGGGGGPTATPTQRPTATPGPTVPPEINMTQEEWLNLTLEQKQEILTNLSMFPPLLEFKWEDIYVWGIHLFLILCGIVALDSITIQRVSEYTGLWAILPGVMFAYLTGYLII